MGARGPQAKAALSVIGINGVEVIDRPKSPIELTDEQRQEWLAVVNAHAADRFTRGQHPMLAAHCRHVVAQRRIAQLIAEHESSDDFNPQQYDHLLKMQERESRCLASLAVRLGFAYSTAYEKRPPKGSEAGGKPPWEFDSDGRMDTA